MTDSERLNELLQNLAEGEAVPASAWPADATVSPEDLGLMLDEDAMLHWPEVPDTLDPDQLAQALPNLQVGYFPVIDSTNTQLVTIGATSSVANHLYLAEFQSGGRGRRGRTWISPYARNLALSLGVATRRTLPELGGLSLVVGLALADVFETLAVDDVQLKWPNDVLVSGHKLSGVLVELVQRGKAVEAVVGIGINVHITETEATRIEQPVTDLRRHGVVAPRTELVAVLVRKLREHLELFEQEGFGPFVTAFNDLHVYHGETCALVQGKHTIVGEVQGIGEQGELLLRTSEGVQRFHGGEVSLRPK